MLRRIALPALMVAFTATAAAAQAPAPQPAPQNPAPQNPQNQPYPQASPQANPAAVSAADSLQIQQGRQFATTRVRTLLNGITVTAEQRGRIDSIMLRYQPDFPAGSPENATDSTLIKRWNVLLPRLDNEVRLVLTAEQQRTWDRNVTEMNNRRRGIGDR